MNLYTNHIQVHIARELAPDAKLFLNEYDTIKPSKRDALYTFVKELQAKSIPIDGIGLQFHLTLGHPEIEELEKTIEIYVTVGVIHTLPFAQEKF